LAICGLPPESSFGFAAPGLVPALFATFLATFEALRGFAAFDPLPGFAATACFFDILLAIAFLRR
jgi:hypothetical protein